jgi:hypothetical protein
MRDATAEDIGHDAMSSIENRKFIARKPLRKAIVACFILGLSDGEVLTAINRAYAHCVAERAHRRERGREGA